jgi:hypothetical protein
LDNLRLNLTYDDLITLEGNYSLSVVSILTDYYGNGDNEEKNTREYYRIITSENFIANIDEIISKTRSFIDSLHTVLSNHIMSRIETKDTEYELDGISK